MDDISSEEKLKIVLQETRRTLDALGVKFVLMMSYFDDPNASQMTDFVCATNLTQTGARRVLSLAAESLQGNINGKSLGILPDPNNDNEKEN